MRLGLLSDIHEEVGPLAACLESMKTSGVDAFVLLGDVFESGQHIEDAVALLEPLPLHGVWGNHDLGLCGELDPDLRARFPSQVLDFFARLRPWVELAGCRFQHIDPHLDPTRFEHLWMFASPEERAAGLARSTHRRVFVGHHHRWSLITPEGELFWGPFKPARLQPEQRYLITVGPVFEGWCGVFDTESEELTPILAV